MGVCGQVFGTIGTLGQWGNNHGYDIGITRATSFKIIENSIGLSVK
jgi:hypothetical protein